MDLLIHELTHYTITYTRYVILSAMTILLYGLYKSHV